MKYIKIIKSDAVLNLLCIIKESRSHVGFPDGSVVKNPFGKAGDLGLIRDLGRSPRGGHGSPQDNPVFLPGKRSLEATVHGVTKDLDMT